MGARSVTDKIVAIVFPVTAFAALGFEHSIANWFFLPFGLMLDRTGTMSIYDIARNLVAVTAGYIAGGTLLVAGVHTSVCCNSTSGEIDSWRSCSTIAASDPAW